MERLVSTNEACEILGLSLQGVHYRIKKGLLRALKQDGKVFVYIDTELKNSKKIDTQTDLHQYYHKEIMKLKDEEIDLLKQTIDWLKEKYEGEIVRLEGSQQQITKVFNDQISLLQKAFNEMREVYKINHISTNIQAQDEPKTISVKEFFLRARKKGHSETKTKEILIEAIKNGDKRFVYDKTSKNITIFDGDFLDLI